MQKTIFFSLLLCIILQVNAQEKNKLTAAALEAGKQNKMLMLVIRSKECSQCNDVADAGMKAAKANIDSNCIVLIQDKFPEEIGLGKGLFLIPNDFFGALFFDSELNILGLSAGSSSANFFYIEAIQRALTQFRNNPRSFKNIKQEYFTNIGDFTSIQKLVSTIRAIGLEPASSLIDELTQRAPVDSATSISFLQYLFRAAPVVGSAARIYVEKSKENFNVAWYRMSLSERQQINQRINSKSLQKAISEKNPGYANQVAYFVQSTYSDNLEEGQKANGQLMLRYYKGVNDTVNYLRSVFSFYDRFYMNVKPEAIKLEDSLNKTKMLNNAPLASLPPEVLARIPDSLRSKIVSSKTIRFTPRAQFYAQSLNDGAWAVYKYSRNSTQLNKALLYSKRALEFYETPEVADTYARLLYKTGNIDEAIIWEQKAISGRIKQNLSAAEFEKVLQLMKKGADQID